MEMVSVRRPDCSMFYIIYNEAQVILLFAMKVKLLYYRSRSGPCV